MKKTIDFLLTVTLLLAIALLAVTLPTEKDAAIYEDTLRLHILANSNDEDDQALKYSIRDKLLQKYGELLGTFNTPEDAKEKIIQLIPSIETDVNAWIREAGFDYSSSVLLDVEWYETREYDSFTLPKGYYTSLQVMLGNAEGKNWWCVMYPPLCVDIATETTPTDDAVMGYSQEEYTLITDKGYNVKFKLLEVFSGAFSKNG